MSFTIIVLQHTDCGITRLVGDPAKLAHYFQIQEGELKTKAVTDPQAAVAFDVAALRAIPALPGSWLISGPSSTTRGDRTYCRDRGTASADSYCAKLLIHALIY